MILAAVPAIPHALEWTLWWTLVILTILVSALCNGMETGCYILNRVRLDLRAARHPPDRAARVIRTELDRPGRLLATLLITNTVASAVAAEATARLLHMGGYSTLAIGIINTVVLSPILFVAGDALPKELFRVEADKLVPMLAFPLRLARVLLTAVGVLPLVNAFAFLLEKALKLPEDSATDARQRIAILLKEGAGHGVLSESQATLVDRALAFRGVKVTDEMTRWADVRVLPVSAERSRLLELIGQTEHAFFPCVDRSGRVLGVIRQLDVYTQSKKSTQELCIQVPRLSPDMPAREALSRLRLRRMRIGIVEDATGRPMGIVTAKDLVEPLTGELVGL